MSALLVSHHLLALLWLLPALPLLGFLINGGLAFAAAAKPGPADPSAADHNAHGHGDHDEGAAILQQRYGKSVQPEVLKAVINGQTPTPEKED